MAATEELPPWEVLDGAFLPEENCDEFVARWEELFGGTPTSRAAFDPSVTDTASSLRSLIGLGTPGGFSDQSSPGPSPSPRMLAG